MIIKKYTDEASALRALTDELLLLMKRKEEKPFHLALSGGNTAQAMFALWVDEYKDTIEWYRLHFFWVDERCVDPSSPESNYGNASRLLFQPLQIAAEQIHRIRGEDNPEREAVRYSQEIASYVPLYGELPEFDCIILGVGSDLHTASIFPDSMKLLHDSHSYRVSQHPTTGQHRITMTGSLILNHAPLLVPIPGKEKEEVVRRLREKYIATHETPAGYILNHARRAVVYVD